VRLSRVRFVSAAVVPLLFLAGCGSSSDAKPSALDVVTVGGTAKAPTVLFKDKPLTVTATTTKVITPGKGPVLTKANAVTFNYVLVNGKDGKQIESNFAKTAAGMDLSSTSLLPGLSKGVTGQKVGSRLLVAIPPADAFGAQGNAQAGFGPTDTILFLIDVVSASTPLTKATGAAVKPAAGLPTVKVDAKGVPVITVPKTPPSRKLVVQPLIKGTGPVVKKGQTLTASYVGLVYGTGKIFDSSYKSGKRLERPVGAGQLVPGFDKGIVGQTVGSRLLMVLPPAEGYGKAGNGTAGIKGTDTLVFVVDILSSL
jgi:peptidylprolyl isomerase